MALFRLPWNYIPDPTRGKPLFYGKIYFGVADQDPLLFPKDVNIIQENGDIVVAQQPIRTSAGGIPVDQITEPSTPIAIDLTGNYSIAIHDRNDNPVYYFSNLGEIADTVEEALRIAAFRLNLDSSLIGTVLVTNQEGQALDGARYILDTATNLLYMLPGGIPSGTTVVSSSGNSLITNNGTFTLEPVYVSAENRFKGNQNWNVAGSTVDPLPSSTPTDYAIGAEIAAGIEVITTDAEQITYVDGVLSSGNNTGIIRRRYTKDSAGFITKNSQYGGVQLPDGTQIQAVVDDIATNGVRITEDSGDVCVDVDLSNAKIISAGGFKFHGLSSEPGVWPDINDFDSLSPFIGRRGDPRVITDVTASRSSGVTYTNDTEADLHVIIHKSSGGLGSVTIDGALLTISGVSVSGSSLIVFTVQSGSSYSYVDTGTFKWSELRLQ